MAAITINSPTRITLSGGSAGAPSTIAHILNIANWPAGTTQATVDSYVTGGSAYTLRLGFGVVIAVAGYLTLSNTCVIHGGGSSRLIAVAGGVIAGGAVVGSYRIAGPTWVFPLGGLPEHGAESFVEGGRLALIGLTIVLSPISGLLGLNFVPTSGGSYSLTRLEIVCAGSDAWLNLGAVGLPCVCSLDQAQVHVVRQFSADVALTFGGAGVAGQLSGLGEQFKLLVPNGYTVSGLSLALEGLPDYAAVTSPQFTSPTITFLDCRIDPTKTYTYPTDAAGAANTITHRTTTTVSPVDAGGVAVAGCSVYVAAGGAEKLRGGSGTSVLTHAVGVGATVGGGQYKGPTTLVDHRDASVVVQQPGYLRFSGSLRLGAGSVTMSPALAADPHYHEAAATAGVAVDYASQRVTVTQSTTCDGIYGAIKRAAASIDNVDKVWYFAASGTTLALAAPWVLEMQAPVLPGARVDRLVLATAAVGAVNCLCGLVDANGDSYLSFDDIDSWIVYSDPARTVQIGAGAGSALFRFVYAPGVTYYLKCVAGSTEFAMVTAPAGAGGTPVTLSTQALLTTLQVQVAAVKADTGLIRSVSL